jgi:hypothetical protein
LGGDERQRCRHQHRHRQACRSEKHCFTLSVAARARRADAAPLAFNPAA